MTKKSRNIVIGIMVALVLLLLTFGYRDITRTSKMGELEKQIIQKEVVISGLKVDLERQGEISDSLFDIARQQDSLIKDKEQQIIDIRNKYNKIKKEVNKLNSEEAVVYLAGRLSNLPNYIPTGYPILVEYEKKRLVMIDTNQNRQLNLVFVELDAVSEELDSTKSLVESQQFMIADLWFGIESQNEEIKICKNLVAEQDSLISLHKDAILEKDKTIKKLDRRNKIKSAGIWILGTTTAIFGILTVIGASN